MNFVDLYNNLMALTEQSEAFYYVDQVKNGHLYRIFNYRLASYTDFLAPSALECRGVMFEIDENGTLRRLASLPMAKFFNYRENPFTMDADLSTAVEVFDKADGSLISTYIMDGEIHVKSKTSLYSDQAVAAHRLLQSNQKFIGEVYFLELAGYTVNMEYVAPDNRIVIGYDEPKLIILNARCRRTGRYATHEYLMSAFGADNVVKRYEFKDRSAMVDFLERLPSMTGIEGVVVRLADGLEMKIKTEAYLTAHRAKDSINSDRRLFEAVLDEATDDLRSLFFEDEQALQRIAEMEEKVDQIYNHFVDTVERFYQRNKDLTRKEYAILGQQELTKMEFGSAMFLYSGRQPDYKEALRKNFKNFGIKDDAEVPVDD